MCYQLFFGEKSDWVPGTGRSPSFPDSRTECPFPYPLPLFLPLLPIYNTLRWIPFSFLNQTIDSIWPLPFFRFFNSDLQPSFVYFVAFTREIYISFLQDNVFDFSVVCPNRKFQLENFQIYFYCVLNWISIIDEFKKCMNTFDRTFPFSARESWTYFWMLFLIINNQYELQYFLRKRTNLDLTSIKEGLIFITHIQDVFGNRLKEIWTH